MRTFARNIVGKTIVDEFEIDEQLILTFSDGTYTALNGGYGDCGRNEVEKAEMSGPSESYRNVDANIAKQLLDSTVWDAADYAIWEAGRSVWDRKYQQEAEARERSEYERLRAKYAPKSGSRT